MKKNIKRLREQQEPKPVIAPTDEIQSLLNLQNNLPGLKGRSSLVNLAYGPLGPIQQVIGRKTYTAAIKFVGKTSGKEFYVLYDGRIIMSENGNYIPYVKDGKELYYDNYQNYAVTNLVNPFQKTLAKFGLTNIENLYAKLGKLSDDLNKVTQKGALGDNLLQLNNLLTYYYPNGEKRLMNAKKEEISPTDMDERNLTQNYFKCNLNRYGLSISDDDGKFYIPKGTTCGLVKSTYNLERNECKEDLITFFKAFLYRNVAYDEDNIRDTRERVQRCKVGGQYEGLILKSEDFGELDLESRNNPFRNPNRELDFCEIAEMVSQDPAQNVIFNLTPYKCDRQTRRIYRKEAKRKEKQSMENNNQNESLDRLIKKTLIEAQENKKRVIQEEKIIKTRFNFILESIEGKKKINENEIFRNILAEMIYMEKQGFDRKLISENVMSVFGVLSNLFGRSTSGIIDSFKEKGVEWIVEKLGWTGNSYMKNFLITALGNVNVMDVPKLFTDCQYLTSKIAETIPEAYLRKLEYQKGIGGMFSDVVRNTLYDVIRNSDFSNKLEASIGKFVCPIVQKLTGIFSDKLGGMKTKLVGS